MSNRTITLSLENIDECIGHQDFSIDYCARARDRAVHQVTRDYWQGGVDGYTAVRDRLVKVKEYLQKEEIEVLPTSFRARPIEDASDELPAHTEVRARAPRAPHSNYRNAHSENDGAA